MNYYRLTFKWVTHPDPSRPFYQHIDWFDRVIEAQNRTDAKIEARALAAKHDVDFVDAIKLPKVVGAMQIKQGYVMAPLP